MTVLQRIVSGMKQPYALAIAAFLMMPVVAVLGALLSFAINPEIAAKSSNYERNYHLLEMAQHLLLVATLLLVVVLWFLVCFFLLKSKKQALGWLALAVLGPFGLIVLTILPDREPDAGDVYQHLLRRLNVIVRVAYELCFFVAAFVVATQAMILKRGFMIWREAAATGASVAQIIEQQNASSGMYAFSEGLEILCLVVLIYLFWPVLFNVVGRVLKLWSSPAKT